MVDLYGCSLVAIFFLGLAVIFGATEIGWQLGIRSGGRGGDNVSTLESAAPGNRGRSVQPADQRVS